jgi:cardiolipin synthase
LILDYATSFALTNAAKSGVDVRIIMPHIPDKKAVFELGRAHYEELLEAGVRIFEYTPGFIHGKNFVMDDRYATVGTVNMDYRSMFLHFEDGVLLYETDTVADLKRDFLKTQESCQEITLAWCRGVSGLRRFFRGILKVFAPLL